MAMAKKNVDESPMMKQFRELKEKHPEALLLFRCGDFYETYENDAKVAAKVLGITLTKSTTTGVRMAGFPHHALDTYLPKLVRYCNTPDAEVKRIAICDQLPDPPKPKRGTTETNNESKNQQTSEDKTMKTNETKNETKDVQNAAQVSNVNTGVDVPEVDDIVPKVTAKPKAKPAEKPAVTMPLGSHGTLVIASVGGKKKEEPKANSQKPEAKVQDSVPQVRLVVYTTRHGDQAPRIDGFGGEDDPRWKRHYDEKLRLKEAAKEADKKNEKLKARMKGKSKEEKEKMMKQWVSVGSDPFNATVRTDFTTGDKAYFMLMGAKYLDVARELVDAYNSGDAAAIAAAEQAVMDVKNGIVAERKAAREAKKAEEANTIATPHSQRENRTNDTNQSTAGYSAQDVAAMLQKVLAGGELPKDVEALMKKAA